MEIIETKVIKRKIKISQAREKPMFNFGEVKKTRNRLKLGMPSELCKCLCGHKFADDEMVWLIIASPSPRFVCKDCNNKILKSLKEEMVEDTSIKK